MNKKIFVRCITSIHSTSVVDETVDKAVESSANMHQERLSTRLIKKSPMQAWLQEINDLRNTQPSGWPHSRPVKALTRLVEKKFSITPVFIHKVCGKACAGEGGDTPTPLSVMKFSRERPNDQSTSPISASAPTARSGTRPGPRQRQ